MGFRSAPYVAAAVLGLAACAGGTPPPAAAPGPLLAPWRTVAGGFLTAAVDPLGYPRRPGGGPFVKLVHPTAVALLGNDLLIVDSGANRLYRYELALQALVPIAEAPAIAGTQVALGSDLSAYVLDVNRGRVLRFARDGRLLQSIADERLFPKPLGFALREARGEIVMVDALFQQLVTLRPLSGAAYAATPRAEAGERVADISGIAASDEKVCLADRAARAIRCVGPDGRQQELLSAESLRQPGPMAIDRHGRVLVADPLSRDFKLFDRGRLAASAGFADLGLRQVGGIALDGGFLAVADPPAGQVAIFTLRPPGP